MRRRLLVILPALAAAVVAWAVLGTARPEPVLAVQLLGGPPRGRTELSLLLRCVWSTGSHIQTRPEMALRVDARSADGANAVWRGVTDATGHAEVRLAFRAPLMADPAVSVRGESTGEVLAHGVLALGADEWRAGARRQGGWVRGQTRGELALRVAPARGILAVPFDGELVVQVGHGAAQSARDTELAPALAGVTGASLAFELEGAERVDAGQSATETAALGLARLALRPVEHAVSLRVKARAGEREGEWYGALPVAPGALEASLDGARLRVASPIPREHAFVSVVSESARLAGAVVPLEPDARGGARGEVVLEPGVLAEIERSPSWAVVSSEYDKRSPAVVGWPLRVDPALPGPPLTFDVSDRMLLDGLPGARSADARSRLERRRVAAGFLVLIGAALAGVFWLEVRRPRSALESADAGSNALAPAPGAWVIATALACVMLGVLALAWFATLQR